MNIYEKLQKARVDLQILSLKKSGHNKFANYNYFELNDFLPSVNEIFNKLKLFGKFDLLEDKATLTIFNAENTEEFLVFESPKTEAQLKGATSIQQIGATHTYLRRYLYMNALEITENDVVDATTPNNNNNNNNPKEKSKSALTPEEMEAKRQDGIKAILKNIEKLTPDQLNILNLDLVELEKMKLSEILKTYKQIEKMRGERNE